MSEELKFPVMYAVLELKEEGGYCYNYEDITRGFVVSKCYVLKAITNYEKDGTAKTSYLVSFPYNNIKDFRYELSIDEECSYIGKATVPHKEANDDWSRDDTTIVWDLFSTYEEAKELANIRNKELRQNAELFGSVESILSSSTKQQCKIRLTELETSLKICETYEALIQNETSGMMVTGISNPTRVLFKK